MTEIQRWRGKEIQRYRDTEIKRYRDTEIQRYRDTEIQRYRNDRDFFVLYLLRTSKNKKDSIHVLIARFARVFTILGKI